jgi:DNA replication protein DnaC
MKKATKAKTKAKANPAPVATAPDLRLSPMQRHDVGGDKTPAQPLADVMTTVNATLERMRSASAAHAATVTNWLAGQPTVTTCRHQLRHQVNVEETIRRNWQKTTFVAVYDPCSQCIKDEDHDNRASWLHSAGVPKILLGSTLDNWRTELASDVTILSTCRQWARDGAGFLILHGPVGLGKSHLAVAIMRERRMGRLVTQNTFLMRLRKTYRDDHAEDVVDRCKRARLLVLDEMGVSTGGRDEYPALHEVLSHRYGEMLPTIITTNVQLTDFKDAFGDRITDRLLSSGCFLEFRGKSKR